MFQTQSRFTAKEMALYGLFIALVYVSTAFINIPGITPGGLIHLGTVTQFTIAIVFGKKAGAISSAVGMSLFDLLSPYFAWAPFTFVIRFAMGYILGNLAFKATDSKIKNYLFIFSGIIIASIIMMSGYYIAEVILYGSWYSPMQSIFGNFMQCVLGTVLGLPLSISIKTALKRNKLSTDL